MRGRQQGVCLLCRLTSNQQLAEQALRRAFHNSRTFQARKKPSFVNVKAIDLELIDGSKRRPKHSKQHAASTTDSRYRTPALQDPRGYDKKELAKALEEHIESTPIYEAYTPREKQLLALKYTSAQMRSLELAEKTIDLRDMARQGRMRDDMMRLDYKDDLSLIRPYVDHPTRAPDEDIDPDIKPLTEEETVARFTAVYEDNLAAEGRMSAANDAGYDAQEAFKENRGHAKADLDPDTNALIQEINQVKRARDELELGFFENDGLTPAERMEKRRQWAQRNEVAEADDLALMRFSHDPANFFYSPRGKLDSQQDVQSQELPKMKDPRVITESESDTPHLDRLSLATGYTAEDIKKFKTKNLIIHRVVNQTRMGKIQSMYVLAMSGNGKGMLGIGESKSVELDEAIRKAQVMAVRNMKPIPMYEDRTIYGEVEGKVAASIVKLSARPPGFGVRCQSLIFELARAAGIQDLAARCLRSRNKMNVVKAAYAALQSQRMPEEIAMARGRKMVDVRKVYYSGRDVYTPSRAELMARREAERYEKQLPSDRTIAMAADGLLPDATAKMPQLPRSAEQIEEATRKKREADRSNEKQRGDETDRPSSNRSRRQPQRELMDIDEDDDD